ncbi:MAG: 4Fe-4S binding protein [bacterium]
MRRLAVLDNEKCVGCQCCMFACARRTAQGGLAESRIGIRSKGGIEHGFVVIVCRACAEPQCSKVCPTDALVPKKGGGVTFYPNKCIGCELCVKACPIGAVFWDSEINKPMICIACGYCVDYCPCSVIALEIISEVENA